MTKRSCCREAAARESRTARHGRQERKHRRAGWPAPCSKVSPPTLPTIARCTGNAPSPCRVRRLFPCRPAAATAQARAGGLAAGSGNRGPRQGGGTVTRSGDVPVRAAGPAGRSPRRRSGEGRPLPPLAGRGGRAEVGRHSSLPNTRMYWSRSRISGVSASSWAMQARTSSRQENPLASIQAFSPSSICPTRSNPWR